MSSPEVSSPEASSWHHSEGYLAKPEMSVAMSILSDSLRGRPGLGIL